MQSRMEMLRALSWPVGRAARCACAMLLIALGFGCASPAHAKNLPDTVLEVTPAGGSTFGEKLTFYAIVSSSTPGGPVPTGTLEFAYQTPSNIYPVCTMTIDPDQSLQSCTPPPGSYILPAGSYHMILIYSGDDNYKGNADGSLASEDYVIAKQTPTVAIDPPPTIFIGQYATINLRPGNAIATTGAFVASLDDATSGGAGTECRAFLPQTLCALSIPLQSGTYDVLAGFLGDENHNAVAKAKVGQVTVLPMPTELTIESHPAIALGDTAHIAVTLRSIVSPDDDSYFQGAQVFLDDGEVVAACYTSLPPYNNLDCAYTPTSVGTHRFTVKYSGWPLRVNFSTATGMLEVTETKVDAVCGSDNGAVLAAPPTNLCSAGTPSAVSGSGHPWSWICAGIGGGSDASCSATAETTTKPVPVLAWPAPAPIVYGTALGATQLNATATWNGNPVAGAFTYTPAAGTVLDVGPNQVLSATFVPSDTASYATPGLPVTTTITVNSAPRTPVTMTLTASPATITQGQSVLLSATVSGSATNSTAIGKIGSRTSPPVSAPAAVGPTGSVTFRDGDTVIGSVNLDANGIAALSVATLAAGTHDVVAAYAGDGTFASATASVRVVVTAAAQAPAAAPALDPAALWLLVLLFAGLGVAARGSRGRLRVR